MYGVEYRVPSRKVCCERVAGENGRDELDAFNPPARLGIGVRIKDW